jgi:predicted nucleotidyltransferase
MGTEPYAALFGQTRNAILGLLFRHPDEQFHLREVVRRAGRGVGAVQRELSLLCSAGVVHRDRRGNQVVFAVNTACPIFAELRSIMMKTAGLADVLRGALRRLSPRIQLAFVFGSFAAGRHGADSDVDLLIVSHVRDKGLFADVASALKRAEAQLGRAVNPILYTRAEFREKLRSGHHFLRRVLDAEKIFLIGDGHGLDRLAQERVGPALHAAAVRDRRAVRSREARPAR